MSEPTTLRDALIAGALGVRWDVPEWSIDVEGAESLMAFDEEFQLTWRLSFERELALDLGERHLAHLSQRLEWHARRMFEQVFRPSEEDDPLTPTGPRTADPEWSAMVDVEVLTPGSGKALRTVHRMSYQPGFEVIMGHLLLPTAHGLFEARCVGRAETTGYRESALMIAAGDGGFLTQAEYDAPEHDDAFDQHVLTRVRRGLAAALASGLNIESAAVPSVEGAVELQQPACSVVPPPRFARADTDFRRVSFCTTDGIETFFVEREGRLNRSQLADYGKKRAHEEHASSGVTDIELDVREEGDFVFVIVRGQGHGGSLRNSMAWVLGDDGHVWWIALFGDAASPDEAVLDDLRGAAQSLVPAKT